MTALYLAGKVEEEHLKLRDVINVCHRYVHLRFAKEKNSGVVNWINIIQDVFSHRYFLCPFQPHFIHNILSVSFISLSDLTLYSGLSKSHMRMQFCRIDQRFISLQDTSPKQRASGHWRRILGDERFSCTNWATYYENVAVSSKF